MDNWRSSRIGLVSKCNRQILYSRVYPVRFHEIHAFCQMPVVQIQHSHWSDTGIASSCKPIEAFVFLWKFPRPSHRIRIIIGGNPDMLILLLSHTTWFYRSDSFLLLSLAVHPVRLPASKHHRHFWMSSLLQEAIFPYLRSHGHLSSSASLSKLAYSSLGCDETHWERSSDARLIDNNFNWHTNKHKFTDRTGRKRNLQMLLGILIISEFSSDFLPWVEKRNDRVKWSLSFCRDSITTRLPENVIQEKIIIAATSRSLARRFDNATVFWTVETWFNSWAKHFPVTIQAWCECIRGMVSLLIELCKMSKT
jgi:hypothetical protein